MSGWCELADGRPFVMLVLLGAAAAPGGREGRSGASGSKEMPIRVKTALIRRNKVNLQL